MYVVMLNEESVHTREVYYRETGKSLREAILVVQIINLLALSTPAQPNSFLPAYRLFA
jgi:hypothetical protein